MTRLIMCAALVALTSACAGSSRVTIQPGTDMAIQSPDSSGAVTIVALPICILAGDTDAERQACTGGSERLRTAGQPGQPGQASGTKGRPPMRVRVLRAVFRRG